VHAKCKHDFIHLFLRHHDSFNAFTIFDAIVSPIISFQSKYFARLNYHSRITVVTMAGAAIAIHDAAAADTVLSVKQRVYAANCKLYVRQQRLVYTVGPRGMDALADDETLGGAGVAQDGTAELDVLVADLTEEDKKELGDAVRKGFECINTCHTVAILIIKNSHYVLVP
jgi:hypothetical protein